MIIVSLDFLKIQKKLFFKDIFNRWASVVWGIIQRMADQGQGAKEIWKAKMSWVAASLDQEAADTKEAMTNVNPGQNDEGQHQVIS